MFRKALLAIALLLSFYQNSLAQQGGSSELLTVYLDCRGCNSSFIRSEINFINFVRDQGDAEVHLIITRTGTASGGSQYTLGYIGANDLQSLSNELIYTSYDSDTDDEERRGLVRYIKLGMIPFLSKKDALSDLDVSFSGRQGPAPQLQNSDKWNSWLFEVGGNTWYSGEESQNTLNLSGRTRIRRITDEWKIQLNYDYNYRRKAYKETDSNGNETIDVYTTDSQGLWGLIAYSLNDHWSVGSYMSGGSSSSDNIDLRYGATPSIEFSFYPYREYSRREVTLRYGILTSFYDYTETTVYNQNSETLVRQELSFYMDYTKPWGGIVAGLDGRQYLHDTSKYRVNARFQINMRVVRGFNVFFNTQYSIIKDQLSLSAAGLTKEEILAGVGQQATSYSFNGSVGFEITFGSIYDNVVNTRF